MRVYFVLKTVSSIANVSLKTIQLKISEVLHLSEGGDNRRTIRGTVLTKTGLFSIKKPTAPTAGLKKLAQ